MGRGQPGSRKMAMWFEGVLLGCSVTPSKARDGNVRLNIKSLGGRTSDFWTFYDDMTARLEARVSQTRQVSKRLGRVYVWAPVVPKRKVLSWTCNLHQMKAYSLEIVRSSVTPPLLFWSYGAVKLADFLWFCLHWRFCAAITPQPYQLQLCSNFQHEEQPWRF